MVVAVVMGVAAALVVDRGVEQMDDQGAVMQRLQAGAPWVAAMRAVVTRRWLQDVPWGAVATHAVANQPSLLVAPLAGAATVRAATPATPIRIFPRRVMYSI